MNTTYKNDLTKLSVLCVTLALADFTISALTPTKLLGFSLLVGKVMNGEIESLDEINEALMHASRTRNDPALTQRQRDIIDSFINDLLESRLVFTKC
jgi:hypothetical protein